MAAESNNQQFLIENLFNVKNKGTFTPFCV